MLISLLAQFWGVVFVIMSVAMFIRRDNIRAIMKLVQDEGMVVFSGFLGVMLGVGHILLFNIWSTHWTIILTLIGWITLFKGLIRVFIPKKTQKFITGFHSKKSNTTAALLIIFVIGIYLVIKGFKL